MFVGSGSIRAPELGPLVTLGNLRSVFPYDDALHKFVISGAQLRHIFAHIMQPENRDGEGECYQINRGVEAVYVDDRHELEALRINGQPVEDDRHYSICLQGFHYQSSAPNIGLTNEELTADAESRVVTTSARDVLEEYLGTHQNLNSKVEGRLTFRATA
jgi:5'-nucleotidase